MLGQTDLDAGSSFGFGPFLLFWFIFAYVLAVIPFIGIFQKAGKPTWAAFVPIYNYIVLIEVIGRPAWWILLFLIPIVSFIVFIVLMIDLAKSFGKGTGFAIGLILLNFIFMLILGFGSARYLGPAASAGSTMGAPPPPPPPPAG
jgi:hypothetical protein